MEIWRFRFSFCMADSWAFYHNKPHDGNDFRSVAPSASKIQSHLVFPSKASPKYPKDREKSSRPAVLKRLQIAVTNIGDFGATPFSLMGMRTRHVTKSNSFVEQKSSIGKLPIIWRRRFLTFCYWVIVCAFYFVFLFFFSPFFRLFPKQKFIFYNFKLSTALEGSEPRLSWRERSLTASATYCSRRSHHKLTEVDLDVTGWKCSIFPFLHRSTYIIYILSLSYVVNAI